MRPPAASARRWAATCSFSRRSSASASNSSLRTRRYSLDSPGKWTFGSRSTSRHLFMSRGLPLRAMFPSFPMLRTLSLVEWDLGASFHVLRLFVGQPTQPSNIAKRVLRPSANSGCVKIASATSAANKRLLDRVRHFVEPRLAILVFEHMDLGDRHWQSAVFGVCQAKGLSLSRVASGSDENHASSFPGGGRMRPYSVRFSAGRSDR